MGLNPNQDRVRRQAGRVVVPRLQVYADFQAMIQARASNGAITWSNAPAVTSTRKHFTTAAAATGVMLGSSWGPSSPGWTRSESVIARIVQHGLPSQAVFNDQVANGRDIYIDIQPDVSGYTDLPAVSRNGFPSTAYTGASISVGILAELLYWDGTQAQRMVPISGLGPTPFPF